MVYRSRPVSRRNIGGVEFRGIEYPADFSQAINAHSTHVPVNRDRSTNLRHTQTQQLHALSLFYQCLWNCVKLPMFP